MQIELDAVVHEYVLMSLASMKELVSSIQQESLQEKVTMSLLKSMVALGTVSHQFDPTRKMDVFRSTPRLVWNWGKIFPGQTLQVAGDQFFVYEMSGRRSRFFNKKWLSAGREDAEKTWQSIVGLDS